MNYAPVAPITILEQVAGPYNLLIAPHVLSHESRFANLFEQLESQYGRRLFTILDNGMIETGLSHGAYELLTAARIVEANCIVLPDVRGSVLETVAASADAAGWIRANSYQFKLMGVVHGSNYDDFVQCAELLIKYAHVDYIGIPRLEQPGDRIKLAEALSSRVQIHFLGFCAAKEDNYTTNPDVLGIDSAEPIWRMLQPEALKRPEDYWTWETQLTPAQVHRLHMLQGLCND